MSSPQDPDDYLEDDEFPDFANMTEGLVNEFLGRAKRIQDRIESVCWLGALSATSDTAYATLLRTACADRSPKVRAEAMTTLVTAGDFTPATFTVLVASLEAEKSVEVQLVGRAGFQDAIPAILRLWERACGDARNHTDMIVQEITGRGVKEWSPKQREALMQGMAPDAVARSVSGCLAVFVLAASGAALSVVAVSLAA